MCGTRYTVKETIFNIFFFFKIDNVTLWNGLDSAPNWSKFQDPDPNTMYLDPQQWKLLFL